MNRILLFITIIMFILSSCVKTRDVDTNDNDYNATILSFGSRVIATKANDVTGNNWEDNVGMFAHLSTGSLGDGTFSNGFMNNIEVKYPQGGNGWIITTGGPYYWPNNTSDKLSFLAYHPYTTVAPNEIPTIESGGIVSIPWTVDAVAANQKDLLYSVIKNASSINRSGAEHTSDYVDIGPTMFEFNHALSKISFKVKLEREINSSDPNYQKKRIFIKSIKISDVYDDGILKFNNALEIVPIPVSDPISATWKPWVCPAADPTSRMIFTAYMTTNGFEIPFNSGEYTSIGDNINTPLVDEGDKNHSLLMVPQEFGDNTKIEFIYAIGTNTVDTSVIPEIKTWTFKLKSTTVRGWAINMHYTYVFKITPGTNDLVFDCIIQDWYSDITFSSSDDIGIWDSTGTPNINGEVSTDPDDTSFDSDVIEGWDSSTGGGSDLSGEVSTNS